MSFACTFFFFFICHMLLILFEQIDLIECLVSCCWICILQYRKPCNEPDFLPISPFPPLIIVFSFIFIIFFFLSPLIIYLVAYLCLFSVCLPACSVLAPSLLPAFRTPQRHSHTRHRDAHTQHWGPIKPSRGETLPPPGPPRPLGFVPSWDTQTTNPPFANYRHGLRFHKLPYRTGASAGHTVANTTTSFPCYVFFKLCLVA